jgi:hypothetical protein
MASVAPHSQLQRLKVFDCGSLVLLNQALGRQTSEGLAHRDGTDTRRLLGDGDEAGTTEQVALFFGKLAAQELGAKRGKGFMEELGLGVCRRGEGGQSRLSGREGWRMDRSDPKAEDSNPA